MSAPDSMAVPKIEKRGTRRFALRLPVTVRDTDNGEIAAHTRDVSSRGICFYINKPLAVGSHLEFILTLPAEVTLTEPIRVRCRARVVRVEEGSGEGLAVAAVIDRYEFLPDRQ